MSMIANDPDPATSSFTQKTTFLSGNNMIIAGIMLFLVMLMIMDTFILPTLKIYEVMENGSTIRSTKKHRTSYFLVMESKRRYKVPREVYNGVAIGERCIIHRTLLFRKPVKISWCRNDNGHVWYNIHEIGILNQQFIVLLPLGYLIFWPLLVLTGIINPDNSKNKYTKFVHLAAAVVSFIFYCCSW